MRTDTDKLTGDNLKIIDKPKSAQKSRKTLQTLQKVAGDKENLVGAGRISLKQDMTAKNIKLTSIIEKEVITAEDLTTEATPGKAYWERLCKRTQMALHDALEENKKLHDRVQILEEENLRCKILLDETRAVVETLTEIVNEVSEENNGENTKQ